MKSIFKISLLTFTLFLLAACGGDSTPSTEATTPPTNAEATTPPAANTETNATSVTGFSATITGALERELTGGGYFMCDDESSEVNIGANATLSNNIIIALPRDAAVGTHQIGTANSYATYIGENVVEALYDHNPSGSITLTAIPSQAGDQVAGNFEFTVISTQEDEQSITVTGAFDFAAGNIAFANCGA